MTLNSFRCFAVVSSAALMFSLLTGCHVTNNKNGKNDNVDVATPFGSMQVKTNDNVNGKSTGLTIYPGAVPVKDDGDNDAADVNMSFGSFHLGVKAMSYQTGDGQDKVISFYRKDMAHFGGVIECHGNETVGKPDRTDEGLTCNEANHSHVNNGHSDDGLELRAGSPQHQHIVSIEGRDGGTRIGLVMLDLPSQIHSHGDKTVE